MNKAKKIIWGVIFIALGLVIALNMLGVINFDLLFDGWWTLFIIIPCAVGLITDRNKLGSLFGLAFGVALLLAARDIIRYSTVWKLLIPAVIVFIGVKMIIKAVGSKSSKKAEQKIKESRGKLQEYSATFTGLHLDMSGQSFSGAELNAVFGGIELDLRGAVINDDVVIKVSSIFAGVDIQLPEDVNLEVSSNCVFGATNRKKRKKEEGNPTVYINTNCIFGGCDIK